MALPPAPSLDPCPPGVSGLFEVCIGLSSMEDLHGAIQYWKQFGFYESEMPRGHLDADAARALYGVPGALTSVRLFHGNCDHGLIRLMHFNEHMAPSPSWGLQNLRCVGARWGAQLSADLFNIHNHGVDAQEAGFPVRCFDPQRCIVYKSVTDGDPAPPFTGTIACVREMLVIQPTAVSNFYQRYDYSIQDYGHVAVESKFKASQVTHCGLTVQGDEGILRFYDEVLGLMRQPDRRVDFNTDGSQEPEDESVRVIMGLTRPGEYYVTTNFDDPRSSTNVREYRSGRLHIQRFPDGVDMQSISQECRPGCIGPCLYTLRATDVQSVRAKVAAADGVTEATSCLANEFGETSFCFVSPDTYMWNVLQA